MLGTRSAQPIWASGQTDRNTKAGHMTATDPTRRSCPVLARRGPATYRPPPPTGSNRNSPSGADRMTIIRIVLDPSNHVFQINGVDENEKPVLRRQLRRGEVEKFFAKLAPTRIGIEACGASHHWARLLRGLGHEVLLVPPQYIKAYVKRGKNDAIDAEAICEAMSRPTMRFVPVKTAEQQAALTMLGVRDLLVKQRTMLINAIRGHAAEVGLTVAKGPQQVVELLQRLATGEGVPALAREMIGLLAGQPERLKGQVDAK